MRQGRLGSGSTLRVLLILAGASALGYLLIGASETPGGATSGGATGVSEVASAADSTATPARQIVAYYFHTTFRCPSCKKIEAYSGEAINDGFPSELADSRLQWLPVNTDEKENEHFVKDFKLYTKSLVLVEMRDGAVVRWQNLPKVWELIGDKPAFLKYVRDEVNAFLDGQS